MHPLIRETTRLLGLAVGISHNQELRNHYISHLKGEIDHEKMLEKDVSQLGYDVQYLKNSFVPNSDIYNFMNIQRSLLAFDRDPELFLVVPLVAEGLSANLSSEFISDLKDCIASWGVENPKSAMTFLKSHIHTDGGIDGHWVAVKNQLKLCLTSENRLKQANLLLETCFKSHTRATESYMEHIGLSAEISHTASVDAKSSRGEARFEALSN